jgi:hypothetical protein
LLEVVPKANPVLFEVKLLAAGFAKVFPNGLLPVLKFKTGAKAFVAGGDWALVIAGLKAFVAGTKGFVAGTKEF